MNSPPARIPRRHDLDALRAIAMLLGIVLHGLISFIPGGGIFWGIQDSQTSPAFGVLMSAIHGWRMPMFFVVSGFFTAMLWRKRGLRALLWHRFLRIFLPMMLALVTVVPATWIVSAYARNAAAKSSVGDARAVQAPSESLDIWGAAAIGDATALRRNLDEGADVNGKSPDGSTPLHIAAFFGREEVAGILINEGADASIPNGRGQTAQQLLSIDWGTTKYIADMYRIPVDEQELNTGREEIAKLLPPVKNSAAAPSAGKGAAFNAAAIKGIATLLMQFPLFGHLWFLWFLCWLVIGFAVLVKLGQGLGLRQPPAALVTSFWRYAWLIPLTAIPQYFMGQSPDAFGPDTSVGLLPMPVVLAYYAIFFGYGAIYFDAQDNNVAVGRDWWWAVPVAMFILLPVALNLKPQGNAALKLLSAFLQVAYAWLMTFGLMGLFHRFCSGESKLMRYLSDASYWLYLAHVPLIMFVQHLVRAWNISAWIKFPLVCLVTSVILLISYQLFIRYTPIGALLNGLRRREAVKQPVPAGNQTPASGE